MPYVLLGISCLLAFVLFIRVILEPPDPGSTRDVVNPQSAEGKIPPRHPPNVAPYIPGPQEEIVNGKKLAADIAQAALTYSRGTTRQQHLDSLSGFGGTASPEAIATVHDPSTRAWAKVIYPQLSGYTGDTMGAMVVVRQTREDPQGRRRTQKRVADVRLALKDNSWHLAELASLGGRPPRRLTDLSPVARKLIRNQNVKLPDTALWDIYRGRIDDGLLSALNEAARRTEISVAVLSTGHPANVWGTSTLSAHGPGYAADIYAVDGKLVINQREVESAAYKLTRAFLNDGAAQVGSPWILETGSSRSFTDKVHQDHIHLQQRPHR